MTGDVRALLDFIELLTYGVSTVLMFIGLGVMAFFAWLLIEGGLHK